MTTRFTCIILYESDKAMKVCDPGDETAELWFPMAGVTEIHRDPKSGLAEVVIEDWLARSKGLK